MEKSAMFADNPYMRHMGPGFQPLYDRFAAPRALSMGEQAGNAFWHGPLRQVEEMGRAMVTGHNNNPGALENVFNSARNVWNEPGNPQTWRQLVSPSNFTQPIRNAMDPRAGGGMREAWDTTGQFGGSIADAVTKPYYNFKTWLNSPGETVNNRTYGRPAWQSTVDPIRGAIMKPYDAAKNFLQSPGETVRNYMSGR